MPKSARTKDEVSLVGSMDIKLFWRRFCSKTYIVLLLALEVRSITEYNGRILRATVRCRDERVAHARKTHDAVSNVPSDHDARWRSPVNASVVQGGMCDGDGEMCTAANVSAVYKADRTKSWI